MRAVTRCDKTRGRFVFFVVAFSCLITEEAGAAILEIHALDIWAQPLTSPTLSVKCGGSPVTMLPGPPPQTSLQNCEYEVKLEAPDHHTLVFTFAFDQTREFLHPSRQTSNASVPHGIALSRGTRAATGGGTPIQVFTFYLGLQHRWFAASGRPARHGNRLRLLMDGEESWNAVANDIGRAKKSIHLSSWMWESNHEVLRPAATHATLSAQARQANTIIAMLDASPATKRVLVWGLPGASGLVTTDGTLRDRGAARGDRFEFMPQANPARGTFRVTPRKFGFSGRVGAGLKEASQDRRMQPAHGISAKIPETVVNFGEVAGLGIPAGSFHQKFIAIDSEVAFVGGMNVKGNDWDTSEHLVFEPRRAPFSARAATREAIREKRERSANLPRKDYMVRIEGPSAQDVGDVFRLRWLYARASSESYAENSSTFFVPRNIQPRNGGIQAQVTTTLPLPLHENSTLESWLNAIDNAERFMYIEDQYFRMPIVNERIVARMTAKPELRLIVVVKAIGPKLVSPFAAFIFGGVLGAALNKNPEICWTRKSHAAFQPFRDRYMLLQLRSFDTTRKRDRGSFDRVDAHFADIDVHSKMLIVDDTYLSVGSTNKNNRGVLFEGEMNVAVANPAFVRAARKRVFANILPAGTPETDDAGVFWRQLQDAARHNVQVYDWWQTRAFNTTIATTQTTLPEKVVPKRFIYPLDVGAPETCFPGIENNPDLF